MRLAKEQISSLQILILKMIKSGSIGSLIPSSDIPAVYDKIIYYNDSNYEGSYKASTPFEKFIKI